MPLVRGGSGTKSIDPGVAEGFSGIRAAELFRGAADPAAALAGLWLYYGGWEEAHEIAQDLPSPEGRYWHGILHRQEPDAWNANYWFRQVGKHPVLPQLAAQSAELARQYPTASWQPRSSWSHPAFVEYCHQAATEPGSAAESLARAIQDREWQLLFAHCAAGSLLL